MRRNRARVVFPDELWSPLQCYALPANIYAENRLRLTDSELKVILVACAEVNVPKNNCMFRLSLTELQGLTGYKEKNSVMSALDGLCKKQFIVPVGERKNGSQEPQRYAFWNQNAEEPFAAEERPGHLQLRKLRAAFFFHRVTYFTLPLDTVAKLPAMTPKSAALLAACARLGGMKFQSQYTTETSVLLQMSGIADTRTLRRAADGLSGQFADICLRGRNEASVELLDPNSGIALDVLREQQYDADQAQREERFATYARHFTPAQIMAWALRVFGEPVKRGTVGEWLYFCPLCGNRKKGKPRFNVTPFKNAYGLWHCFDCKRGGTILDRVMQGAGCTIMEAMMQVASIQTQEPELYAQAETLVEDYGPDALIRRQCA